MEFKQCDQCQDYTRKFTKVGTQTHYVCNKDCLLTLLQTKYPNLSTDLSMPGGHGGGHVGGHVGGHAVGGHAGMHRGVGGHAGIGRGGGLGRGYGGHYGHGYGYGYGRYPWWRRHYYPYYNSIFPSVWDPLYTYNDYGYVGGGYYAYANNGQGGGSAGMKMGKRKLNHKLLEEGIEYPEIALHAINANVSEIASIGSEGQQELNPQQERRLKQLFAQIEAERKQQIREVPNYKYWAERHWRIVPNIESGMFEWIYDRKPGLAHEAYEHHPKVGHVEHADYQQQQQM